MQKEHSHPSLQNGGCWKLLPWCRGQDLRDTVRSCQKLGLSILSLLCVLHGSSTMQVGSHVSFTYGLPTTQRNSWGSEKAIHCLCEATSHTGTVPLQTRPCHVACSDLWLLKQYSLLKSGQYWEPCMGIFFPDILGLEWQCVYSLDSGQAAFWVFDATDAPPKGCP